MTEEELRANISSTYDIYSFCCNNDFYEFIDGWVLADEIDVWMQSALEDPFSSPSWQEMRYMLNSIEPGFRVYHVSSSFMEIDTDCADYLDELIDFLKNIVFFDDEEDDGDELYEDEEFFNPIDDLISVGFYEDEIASEDQSL